MTSILINTHLFVDIMTLNTEHLAHPKLIDAKMQTFTINEVRYHGGKSCCNLFYDGERNTDPFTSPSSISNVVSLRAHSGSKIKMFFGSWTL